MNIAITGISGYMGQKLASRLLQDPDIKITGVDVKKAALPAGHRFYQIDTREDSLQEIFKEQSIDTVIHMAFLMPPFKNKKLAHSINVDGTENILHASLAAGVKKIIIPSSTVVYGAHADNPLFLKENSPYRGNPEYFYYRDKVEVEKLCLTFFSAHPEMDYVIFRMCEVYGPETDMYYSRALEKKNVYLFEGYDPPYQFLHEKDMLECYYTAVKRQNLKAVFNLVPDDAVPLSQAVRAAGGKVKWSKLSPFLIKMCDVLYKLNLFKTPVSSFSYWQYPWTASNKKLKRELRFNPEYTSIQALNSKYKRKGNEPWIAIDQTLCNSCMNCINNCPVDIFQKQNGGISVKNTELCISCGHCITLCGQQAIGHSFFRDKGMHTLSVNGSLTYGSFVKLLKTRHSVRTFKQKSLSDQDLEKIIHAAALAPSAHNIQSTEYMVIKKPELLNTVKEKAFSHYKKMHHKLKNPLNRFFATLLFGREMITIIKEMEIMLTGFKNNKDPFLHNAGCLLLFYSGPTLRSPETNAQLSAFNAMLAAQSLGIGTCYVGYVTEAIKGSKKLRTLLGMPKKSRVHAGLVLGYARSEHSLYIEKNKPVIHKRY